MVEGIGKIPPYDVGNEGPEGAGSSVDVCVSMCDSPATEYGIPCDNALGIPALTPCHPTEPPPPPPYGPKEYTMASAVAATAAGWPAPGAPLPPDAPVVIYGSPPFEGPTLPPTLKVMYGPPPPGIPGVPPPGYGMGTAPPPENVAAAKAQKASFLAVGRRVRQAALGPPPPAGWTA